MQLQLHSSQITKIYFAISSASSILLLPAVYCYCQQYSSILLLTAVASASSIALATENRTTEFYMGVLF